MVDDEAILSFQPAETWRDMSVSGTDCVLQGKSVSSARDVQRALNASILKYLILPSLNHALSITLLS
jgi:hypothetical protein